MARSVDWADDGARDETLTALDWIVPGPIDQPTGGYGYDRRIVAALRALGVAVRVVELPGAYPEPDAVSARALACALEGSEGPAVIDGLAHGLAPDALCAAADRRPIVSLVHHLLADEGPVAERRGDDAAARHALECRVLRAVAGVVTSSAWTARRVQAVCRGLDATGVVAIEPGVEAFPEPDAPARAKIQGDWSALQPGGFRWLCVASRTPRKGHDVLLDALAAVPEARLLMIGEARDRPWARALDAQIERLGVSGRVRIRERASGAELAAAYASADGFVLASRFEGFGMVVTEAERFGLPIVSTTGGALSETARAALTVPVDDVRALAAALRRVSTTPSLAKTLAARSRRSFVSRAAWPAQARHFAAHLAHWVDEWRGIRKGLGVRRTADADGG